MGENQWRKTSYTYNYRFYQMAMEPKESKEAMANLGMLF